MSNILTPSTIWNNFDDSLDVNPVIIGEKIADGVRYERISFLGRETGDGRVKIFGLFASDVNNRSNETVLILPDSCDSVDEGLLKLFVEKGYSAFMVDYRGEWDDCELNTVYPENVAYANTARCGRYKDFVDDSAEQTSWYEWVAVGIYARKYLVSRIGSENIALAGIRDGGEIAWKLGAVKEFSCLITVCAAGWKAYSGVGKYDTEDVVMDEERYRFIAGIDSQAYAPNVKCPVMIMCSTNDNRFDYDRAYDTFSRINPAFADDSVITYSVRCDSSIGVRSSADMFLFLDKHLRHRQVFIPKMAEINVAVDEECNLIATASFDNQGIVDEYGMFMAEECKDSAVREWTQCKYKHKVSDREHDFYLDVYEGTTTVFVLCYARYLNGFTVWSKIAVKKVSGLFKNSQKKCRVMYSAKNGVDCFTVAAPRSQAVGGIFFVDSIMVPQVVTKERGIGGIYSPCGLTTYRMNTPKYAPEANSVLKLDFFSDETAEVLFTLEDVENGQIYKYGQSVLGGVWQTIIIESKNFKNIDGEQLNDYIHSLKFCITCEKEYAVNNLMWL
ncbi:MAG: hypothetical protein K2J83_06945 [Clostridia bacterium]|nr:hypothetical protein [Clostridia bacterium]